MPKVILWREGVIETEFDPGHRDWRMGRSETNDITLLDPRKSVSRFHAELREENGRWVFIDLNSQNGSWRNGERINRLVLEHGHEVQFGDYKLTFTDVRVPPPPAPTSATHGPIGDVGITPDPTEVISGASQPPSFATSAPPPVPVARPRVDAAPTRKGVHPVVVVLFALALLGAAAAVAWVVLSSASRGTVASNDEPNVRQQVPPPATSSVAPAPVVDPPPAPPAPVTPGETTEGVPPAVSTLPPASATPESKAEPEARKTRPKAAPPPAKKDNPTVVARYDEGVRALAAGRFTDAERAFLAVQQQQRGFRDTAALLQQARDGQASARQKSLVDAQAFEASGEWLRAIAAYERAGAADMAISARAKMTAAGDDAYRKARQFDARSRAVEAMTWYERAANWLPDSDARKATAKERLAALKGGAE